MVTEFIYATLANNGRGVTAAIARSIVSPVPTTTGTPCRPAGAIAAVTPLPLLARVA